MKEADLFVKIVMLILVAASIWSWAVIFQKTLLLAGLRRRTGEFEEAFWSGKSVRELYTKFGNHPDHPAALIFVNAIEEWQDSQADTKSGSYQGLLDRIQKVMEITLDREVAQLERNLSSLATVGSTAPFIGLLGTVWGIMKSFQSIALAENTSLTVVAPGIAEALLATALGLVAAIPAVFAYNRLSADIGRLGDRLANFADEFVVVLLREMETKRVS